MSALQAFAMNYETSNYQIHFRNPKIWMFNTQIQTFEVHEVECLHVYNTQELKENA